ncbi:hypothetical protein AAIR98_001922 [Elusimicrobium simillimum]|uniref:hypothetical protein n=1 Tax=Elusimicrobium simillimum TaxID=3143438 RepID=UPI003C6EBC42
MKHTLKFLLALGDTKMVVLDNTQSQEIYATGQTIQKSGSSVRRIASAFVKQ